MRTGRWVPKTGSLLPRILAEFRATLQRFANRPAAVSRPPANQQQNARNARQSRPSWTRVQVPKRFWSSPCLLVTSRLRRAVAGQWSTWGTPMRIHQWDNLSDSLRGHLGARVGESVAKLQLAAAIQRE